MSVGQTSISIAKIIDSAVRRVGLPVELQSPETVEIAKNNLYLILMNLTNRGVNFWAIEEQFVPLIAGKAKYTMPAGTVDVLNSNYRTVTEATGTVTTTTTTHITEFDEATDVVMLYLDSPTASITVSKSTDGVSYEVVDTIVPVANPGWYSIDNCADITHLKLSNATALTITDLTIVSSYRDVPMYRLNRDDYLALPNKMSPGNPLQFWFDRQVDPVMNVWPVPTSATNCIHFFRQRQISDVGSLSTTLDIPARWLEAVTWQLALNLAFEIPGADPQRIGLVQSMAQKALSEAEWDERDNSPINLVPNIGVYTR